MRFDILLRVGAEVLDVQLFAVGELVGNIKRERPRVSDILGIYELDYALGESDRFLGGFDHLARFVSSFGFLDSIRAKMRITRAYIALLLRVGEVLSVAYYYAVIRAAAPVEPYGKIIELELAAPNRENGSRLSSAKITERARLCDVDFVERGNIASTREAVRE